MSWYDALRTLDVDELADLVLGLDSWTHTDENIARLVDRDDYYLRSMYSQWTTDPEDPEVKREIERRRRHGVKPPPEPLIPPIAERPLKQTVDMWEKYKEMTNKYHPEHVMNDGRKKVSIAELRTMLRNKA